MTLFASGYLENIFSTLNKREVKEYKLFLNLRELFRDGYLDIPYIPTFEEISKEDQDDDDNFISEWEYAYNKEKCDKILAQRKEFFRLEKKFEIIENAHIEFYLKNITDDEKITTHFELNRIINLDSADLSIEEFKLYFALNKIIDEVKNKNNFIYKSNNNTFLNVL